MLKANFLTETAIRTNLPVREQALSAQVQNKSPVSTAPFPIWHQEQDGVEGWQILTL